jgi:hypothetical protein
MKTVTAGLWQHRRGAELTRLEAAQLSSVVDTYVNALEVSLFEERLSALETQSCR